MNKNTFLYLGILLCVTPFLGIYTFMKTSIIVLVGVYLILVSRDISLLKKRQKSIAADQESNIEQTAVQQVRTPRVKKNIV